VRHNFLQKQSNGYIPTVVATAASAALPIIPVNNQSNEIPKSQLRSYIHHQDNQNTVHKSLLTLHRRHCTSEKERSRELAPLNGFIYHKMKILEHIPIIISAATAASVITTAATTVATATTTVTTAAAVTTTAAAVTTTAAAVTTAAATSVTAAATSVTATITSVATAASTRGTAASTTGSSTGLGFVDTEWASIQLFSVQLGASRFSIRRGHGHKAKAANLASITISGHETVRNSSIRFEHGANITFRGIKGEVTNVELNFVLSSSVETSSSASAVSTGSAFTLGTRLVNTNGTSIQLGLVHLGDGLFSSITTRESNKAKSTGTLGSTLSGEKDLSNSSELGELVAKLGLISS
jgi:hypothetical protein